MRCLLTLPLLATLAILALFVGCGGGTGPDGQRKVRETPTSGEISVSFDETLQPVGDALVSSFMDTYRKATIHQSYLPQSQLIQHFLADSFRAIVASRNLTDDERSYSKEVGRRNVRTTRIAFDAVCLIINPANRDTAFSWSYTDSLLRGHIRTWNHKIRGNIKEPVTLVFDHTNSSTLQYLRVRFDLDTADLRRARATALKTNHEVVDYVAKHPGALGIIGVSWISDQDDPQSVSFLGQIRPVALGNPPDSNIQGHYLPYQYYIWEGQYPLTREVFVHVGEIGTRLGSGYASYMASPPGQSVIKLAGLLPAQSMLKLNVRTSGKR